MAYSDKALYYSVMLKKPFPFQLRIRSAGGGPLPLGWHWNPKPFNDFDLWLCRGGKGILETDGKTFSFSRGDCIIFRPGIQYRIQEGLGPLQKVKSEKGLLHNYIHFSYVDTSRKPLRTQPLNDLNLFRHVRRFNFLEETVGKVISVRRDKKADWENESETWLRAVLFELRHEDKKNSLNGHALEQHNTIEALCQHIRENPSQAFRIPDLAEQCHYSPEQLTRIFKRLKGQTPNEFIIEVRMEAARELLLFSNLSVKEIAHSLGYSDVYFFSKQFRQRVGKPPKRFRLL